MQILYSPSGRAGEYIDWAGFAQESVALLEGQGRKRGEGYVIKADLARYLEGAE